MATEIKKYLDLAVGLPQLVDEVQAADEKVLEAAKAYADGLAPNYEAAGNAATEAGKVQTKLDEEVARAKAREDEIAGLVATAQGEVDALELVVDTKAAQVDLEALAGKVGEVPEGQNVMEIITNIQENAYDDTELKAEINAELANKADKTQVATDIAAAVKAEEDARKEAVAGVQDAVDTLAETHATDKAAIEGAVALKADKTALDAVSEVANAAVKQADYDVKVKALADEDARIVGLVEAEAEAARAAEEALDGRLEEVEAFFKLAEGEQLDEALDTLKELQDFVNGEGAAADQMILDIAANKKAIEDHVATDHDFAGADAALKTELEAKINEKAAASDVEAIEGRMDDAEAEIDALQAKFGEGEGTISDMVADAVNAEKEAREAAIAEVQADADQGIADAAAALAAANAASAHADELNTAMNTRVEAVEGKAHEHANKALLDTYAQTEENLADAVAKKHAHENAAELAKIADGDVAKWNASEQNAKDFAQGLADATNADVEALEGRMNTVEGAVATKAEASAVSALAERVTTNEALSAENKSRLDSFVAISAAEVSALFA